MSDLTLRELTAKLATDVATLVKKECRLAMRETRTALGGSSGALLGIAFAATLLLFGGGALVAAAIVALAMVWPTWLAAVAVGVPLAAVGGALLRRSIRAVSELDPLPRKTATSVRKDVRLFKEAMR